MNLIRRTAALLAFLVFAVSFISAENWLSDSFSDFGVTSIGIYTEAYEDNRTSNYERDYHNAYATQNVTFFRYTLCNFDKVTPPLTVQGYPLAGKTKMSAEDLEIDEILGTELKDYLDSEDWNSSIIDNFRGGNLSGLLKEADSMQLDAVLLVRYYPVRYFIPISNYSERYSYGYNYSTTSYTANIGKLEEGLGLIPAFELYDTKSGVRLWYSAYHTGQISAQSYSYFQAYVDKAEELFVEGKNPETDAVMNMIDLSLDSEYAPFPSPSDSGSRNNAIAGAKAAEENLSNMFWSNHPAYEFNSTMLGIGYTFDYIGDFNVVYDASSWDDEPGIIIPLSNTMMHRFTMPYFTLETHNISLDPAFYFGFMPAVTEQLTYTDLYDSTTSTENVTFSAINFGMDLALKYYIRFADNFSFYIGARGLFEMWLLSAETDGNRFESYDFDASVTGLIPLDIDMVVNASALFGFRWDSVTPVELFGMFTPIGPGGSPMLSAGFKWHAMSMGRISVHSKNCDY